MINLWKGRCKYILLLIIYLFLKSRKKNEFMPKKKRVLEEIAKKYDEVICEAATVANNPEDATLFMNAHCIWDFAVRFYGNKHSRIEVFLIWAEQSFSFFFFF